MSVHVPPAPAAVAGACRELGWNAGRIVIASGFTSRLLGLIPASRGLAPDPGVLAFPACASVHTCFMGAPCEVAFADDDGRVLLVCLLAPWGRAACPAASFALERLAPARRQASRAGNL